MARGPWPVDREAVAQPVEHRAQGQFRLGVAPADAGHDFGALFRSEDVGHRGESSESRIKTQEEKPCRVEKCLGAVGLTNDDC